MHPIKKQLLHPNLHRHHIQGNILESIAKAIHQVTIAHSLIQSQARRRYYRFWTCRRPC